VAARHADTIVRLPGRAHGPAFARNRGVEVARGEIVVFVDSDVCVHPDTLSRFLSVFDENPEVSAVFGSYDATPSHRGLVSEFRNLLHHFVHQRGAGPAETFWAGCGAVRASAFRQVSMFDEWHYARPQIEDIELGRRLRINGHPILLDPDIQGTHLKRWTLKDFMSTDFQHRGIPWTRLLLQEGPNNSSGVLNLRRSEKICTAITGIGMIGIVVAVLFQSFWPLLAPAGAMATIATLNADFYRFLARDRGWLFSARVLPLHAIYYGTSLISAVFGWVLHILLGEPHAPLPVVAAVGMELNTWPPRPARPSSGVWNAAATPPARGSEATAATGSRQARKAPAPAT
jgi:GT2 family glycosyltransferase